MLTTQKITEKQFMAQVIQLAKLLGWKVYHTFDSRRSVFGFPDLILLRGKRLLAIELKVEKNQPTPEQKMWLRSFAATGAFAAVWTPDCWQSIETELARA